MSALVQHPWPNAWKLLGFESDETGAGGHPGARLESFIALVCVLPLRLQVLRDLDAQRWGSMPTAFRITLKDAPGALGHVAGALAERGINLEASGAETVGGEGRVTLLTSDEGATREVLESHNIVFAEVELLVVTLQDDPGALASIAQRLAAAGVNITSLVQLNRMQGRSDLGMVVDDPEKAQSVLDED